MPTKRRQIFTEGTEIVDGCIRPLFFIRGCPKDGKGLEGMSNFEANYGDATKGVKENMLMDGENYERYADRLYAENAAEGVHGQV